MENNFEVREWLQDIELRQNEQGKEVISGYAIVFDRESEDLGGFKEIIERTAADTVDFSDTVATFNHDANNVLGRVPQTMKYRIDERGVYVEIEPPDTTIGRDTTTLIKRGDVKGMSFTFRISEKGQRWEKPTGGQKTYTRYISKLDVIPELGPVVFPAYRATDAMVAKRALGVLKDAEEKELTDALQKERELNQIKINNQHRALKLKMRTRFNK
jgi:uncharacterized protein